MKAMRNLKGVDFFRKLPRCGRAAVSGLHAAPCCSPKWGQQELERDSCFTVAVAVQRLDGSHTHRRVAVSGRLHHHDFPAFHGALLSRCHRGAQQAAVSCSDSLDQCISKQGRQQLVATCRWHTSHACIRHKQCRRADGRVVKHSAEQVQSLANVHGSLSAGLLTQHLHTVCAHAHAARAPCAQEHCAMANIASEQPATNNAHSTCTALCTLSCARAAHVSASKARAPHVHTHCCRPGRAKPHTCLRRSLRASWPSKRTRKWWWTGAP